ncbi:hypothetical protein V6N12_067051 [Hibiscus sabdariffa]|uniref:Retrotransposon gag domain-containing protein n=1 Tax=Hibiscus sabdariffa TaxID=183260 RepID=A0ABR2BKP9_9ROSI
MNAVHVRDQKHELTPPRNRANPRNPTYELDLEIERIGRELRQRARALMAHQRNNGQEQIDEQEPPRQHSPAPAGRAIVPPIPQNNQQQPVRTVHDYLAEDLEGLNPAITILEFEVEHFELKPLKLFPYSLRDKDKAWLINLPPGSLQSWTELCRSFLAKFSYTNMTDNLRNQITSFRHEDDEAMHEAWERYRDLFRRCPMHGLPEWTQTSHQEKAWKFLKKLTQNDYQHPTTRRGNTRRGTAQLDSSDTILAQISALTNMVKSMQRQSNTQEVKALDAFCELCGNNHDASEYGHAPESSCYVGNFNKNVMSNTYNPAWRKHPNFSWQNQNNTLNPQQPNQSGFQNQPRQNLQQNLPRFIQTIDAFMDRTEMKLQNQDATLKSLETQVGQISQILNTRPVGGFPSDTEVAKGATHEQCKAISTRSGKVLEPTNKQRGTAVAHTKTSAVTDTPATVDIPAKADEDHIDPTETREVGSAAEVSQPEQTRSNKLEEIRPPPPFPQRLKKQKQDFQFKKFFDILKQVHINLPLVEALQQMPIMPNSSRTWCPGKEGLGNLRPLLPQKHA